MHRGESNSLNYYFLHLAIGVIFHMFFYLKLFIHLQYQQNIYYFISLTPLLVEFQ